MSEKLRKIEHAESRVLDEACVWFNNCQKNGSMDDIDELYLAIGDYIDAISKGLVSVVPIDYTITPEGFE